MMEPSVAIVILNWNGWRDTIACLNSLSKLSYKAYKIFVVDNGSKDDSVTRLRTFDPSLEIIETGKNLGFAGGCNVGIRNALNGGFSYVWLLNNDAIADQHALSEMVVAAESDTQIGAVGSTIYYMDSPHCIQACGGGRISFWTGCSRHLETNERLDYLTGASLLLRRDALRQVGLLDDVAYFMYWEDVDLSYRLRAANWRLFVATGSRIWHKGAASTGKDSYTLELYGSKSVVRFFRKHYLFWIWPVFINAGGRFTKRIITGKWLRAKAVYDGTKDALFQLAENRRS